MSLGDAKPAGRQLAATGQPFLEFQEGERQIRSIINWTLVGMRDGTIVSPVHWFGPSLTYGELDEPNLEVYYLVGFIYSLDDHPYSHGWVLTDGDVYYPVILRCDNRTHIPRTQLEIEGWRPRYLSIEDREMIKDEISLDGREVV